MPSLYPPPASESPTDEPILAPLSIFAATAIASLLLHWKLSDLCWGIWLAEVAVAAAVVGCSLGKLFLAILSIRPLKESELIPDGSGREHELQEAPFFKRLLLSAPAILMLLFVTACFFGFYAVFAVALYIFFPLTGIQPRPASLLSLYLFMVDAVVLLIPHLWPVVVGTLLLHHKRLFTGPPAWQILALGERNLMKIHFCLLLLPPIALIVRYYLPDWQPIVLIVLLFVFYYPHGRDHSRRPEKRSPPN